MALTPIEIKNMAFPRKALGGIDEASVRDFLTKVASDFENINKELSQYKEEVSQLRQRITDSNTLETALKDALKSAQKTTGILKQNAEKESLIILKESEIKAEKMLDDARVELKSLNDEIRGYKNLKRKFKGELKNFLQSYMDLLADEEK